MDKVKDFSKLLISARYWLLGLAENDPEYYEVITALEMGLEHHDGYRNGGDPEFVHQLGIFHYLRTMHKHMKNPKTVYKLVFLHDALEDANQKTNKFITPEEIRVAFGEVFLTKLMKMSKEVLGQKNPDFSLDVVFADEDTSIVKGGDRVDNVTSMIGIFKKSRLERYVKETSEEFLPRIKLARRRFPSQEAIYENIKMELTGTLTLISRILDGYEPNEV
jgi:(p)ppGpp synthase/HD superfamily hydrolase